VTQPDWPSGPVRNNTYTHGLRHAQLTSPGRPWGRAPHLPSCCSIDPVEDKDISDGGRRRRPWSSPLLNPVILVATILLFPPCLIATMAGPLVFSEELGLEEEVALVMGMVAMVVLLAAFVKLMNLRARHRHLAHEEAKRRLDEEHRERLDNYSTWAESKLEDVHRVVLRTGNLSPGNETLYNEKLVRRVLDELAPGAILNHPLSTGTRVDAWFEYSGMNWFITVKDRLGNQQRLILQGEVEDILREAKPAITTWVVVVVLTDPEPQLNTVAQLQRLRGHLSDREKELDALMEKAIDEGADAKAFHLRCLDIPLRDIRPSN